MRQLDAIIPYAANERDLFQIGYWFEESPFGLVLIATTNLGLCQLSFVLDKEQAINDLKESFKGTECGLIKTPPKPFQQLFCKNRPPFTFHLKGTAFQLAVWNALLHIPFGKTSTYGEIAKDIGRPKAYRAVGTAVGDNPIFFIVPCHRVLPVSGKVGNYRWGSTLKQSLIDWEKQK